MRTLGSNLSVLVILVLCSVFTVHRSYSTVVWLNIVVRLRMLLCGEFVGDMQVSAHGLEKLGSELFTFISKHRIRGLVLKIHPMQNAATTSNVLILTRVITCASSGKRQEATKRKRFSSSVCGNGP